MMQVAAAVTGALSLAALGQGAAGGFFLRRLMRQPTPQPAMRPPVTVLKPLHGDEPGLEAALESFFRQDYPSFQLVFGVQDAADPALAVLARLRARHPGADVALAIDPARHGSSGKVSNLINMLTLATHDTLVIADSDLLVAPDYLDRVVAALQRPGAGLVTTLYTGRPGVPGLAAALGATAITHSFLPGVMLGRAMGRQDCLGTTMALHRATLDRVGGLPALVDELADDAVLGRSVNALGQRVEIAATVPAATVPEASLGTLFTHELRWGRTIRSLEPVPYALSILQYPLFWALLTVLLAGGAAWSLLAFAVAWAVRAGLARAVDTALFPRAARRSTTPIWLLPMRDILSVVEVLCSYAGDKVEWRGHMMRAGTPPREQALRASLNN